MGSDHLYVMELQKEISDLKLDLYKKTTEITELNTTLENLADLCKQAQNELKLSTEQMLENDGTIADLKADKEALNLLLDKKDKEIEEMKNSLKFYVGDTVEGFVFDPSLTEEEKYHVFINTMATKYPDKYYIEEILGGLILKEWADCGQCMFHKSACFGMGNCMQGLGLNYEGKFKCDKYKSG